MRRFSPMWWLALVLVLIVGAGVSGCLCPLGLIRTPRATATPTPAAGAPVRAVVITSQAKLRGAPGDEFPLLTIYPRGTQLTVVVPSQGDAWLLAVGPDRLAGWMKADSVRILPGAPSAPRIVPLPTPFIPRGIPTAPMPPTPFIPRGIPTAPIPLPNPPLPPPIR